MEKRPTPVNFAEINVEIFKNHEFTAYKCRFTLNLMKLIQKVLKSTFLTQSCVKELFNLMDKSSDLSTKFNNNSLFRFVLWKKGYFSEINFLPSLHISEINVLLAKFYYFKKNMSKDNTHIFDFCISIYINYIEKIQMLDDAYNLVKNSATKDIEEAEINKYYRVKNFEEKQIAIDFIYHLLNEQVNTFLNEIDLNEYKHLSAVDQLTDVLINYLPIADINRYPRYAPVGFVTGDKSENNMSKLKNNIDMRRVLKTLIQLKRSN